MLDNIIQIEEGNISELTKDLAYHNAQDGSSIVMVRDSGVEIGIFKKLDGVPMGYIEGVGFITTLACAHALEKSFEDVHIEWPFSVYSGSERLSTIAASAGFQNGLFASITIAFDTKISEQTIDSLVESVIAELEQWRADVVDKKILAGPVSQCLSEYFDYVRELGHETLVQTPEGKLIYAGSFGGLDVWGHAIVVDSEENEKSFAPGEVILIPAE